MPDIISATELAQKRPDVFLSEHVFKNLYVDEFKFGPAGSGKVDLNMISQCVDIPAHTKPGGLKPASDNELAIHLNCIVKASTLQHNTITIDVEQFHLTARSVAAQKRIDADGPSAITAGNSIHMNVNTGWGREDNLKALAQEVEISKDETLHTEIKSKQGYNGAYMKSLVEEFKKKVEQRIHQDLGGKVPVVVKWKGDKTFV